MITLEQAKDYLQITDTTQDTKIQAIVDTVNAWVVSYIWDIKSSEKSELIQKASIKKNKIGLKYYHPTWMLTVNGSTISDTEYFIHENWVAEFKSLDLSDIDFSAFQITYTAWLEEYPADYLSVLKNIVWEEFYKTTDWKEVKKSKTWPREVTFMTKSEMWIESWKDIYDISKEKLEKFIPLHFKHYAF